MPAPTDKLPCCVGLCDDPIRLAPVTVTVTVAVRPSNGPSFRGDPA